jgi:hypothetical protein
MAKIFLATSASTDLGQTWDRPYPKWLYLLLDFWMQRQGCQKIHPVSIGFELRQGRAIVCHRPIDFGEASAPAFGQLKLFEKVANAVFWREWGKSARLSLPTGRRSSKPSMKGPCPKSDPSSDRK